MTLLLISLLLIGVNGLFVLLEFALVRVRASKMEMLARKGSTRALMVQEILGSLDEYLAAIQMGITILSLALGWIGEPALAALIRGGLERLGVALSPEYLHGVSFGTGLVLLSFLHIVFGELLPRTIGIQKAEVVSLWGALPLQILHKFISLPVRLMAWVSTSLLRLFGLHSAGEHENVLSEDEMRILLGETQEKGALPLERLMLLENLFDIGAAKVAEAMTQRDKIHHLSLNKPWEENLELIRAKRFSRYPLCETDDLDSVIGFVHVKDLLLKPELEWKNPDLKRCRRELIEVNEGDHLEKLLKNFPDKGTHMALVRGPLNKITGLITLEDMVEELIGEVQDEFDRSGAWSLMKVLQPTAVVSGLHAEDRKSAITQLMDKLKAAEPSLNAEEALRTVWERELKFSSAVGRGVAVPHGRLLSLEKPLVALGRFSKPVPFPSPDNVPVRLVFLILTPAQTPVIQLKVLGRIAALITNENLRRKLFRAKTSESLLETVKTGDTLLA